MSLSKWSWGIVLSVSVLVTWTELSRLMPPTGEKYIDFMHPGGADFVQTYLCALAMSEGLDPYYHADKRFDDPWFRDRDLLNPDGPRYGVPYPPTHLALFGPLELVCGGDVSRASKLWFFANLFFLALLVLVTWRLWAHFAPGSPDASTVLLFLGFALALNVATVLALERGQGDLVTSLLCWTAVLLALHDRPALSMGVVVAATLLKGYPVLLGAGLGLMFIPRKQFWRAAAGGAVALLALLAPVATQVPGFLRSLQGRLDSTRGETGDWSVVSFVSLAEWVAPGRVEAAQTILSMAGFAAALVTFGVAFRALRRDPRHPAAGALVVLFAVCALGAMVGNQSLAWVYALIYVLPGALLLGLWHAPLARALALGPRAGPALGGALLAVLASLFLFHADWAHSVPFASLSLFAIIAVSAVLAVRAWRLPAVEATASPRAEAAGPAVPGPPTGP